MRNSLRSRLLFYLSISMVITAFSLGFVLMNSLRLQNIADRRFEDEQSLHELQSYFSDIQLPLQNYLTSYSSSSLLKVLFITEILHEAIPSERPITAGESDLIKREIYFLMDAYLQQSEQYNRTETRT